MLKYSCHESFCFNTIVRLLTGQIMSNKKATCVILCFQSNGNMTSLSTYKRHRENHCSGFFHIDSSGSDSISCRAIEKQQCSPEYTAMDDKKKVKSYCCHGLESFEISHLGKGRRLLQQHFFTHIVQISASAINSKFDFSDYKSIETKHRKQMYNDNKNNFGRGKSHLHVCV